MTVVEISAGLAWYCDDCGVSWPGPMWPGPHRPGVALRFACPHCGVPCKAEVWGGSYRQVEWRLPVCSVPWSACPTCSRPWEYFESERRCFYCDIAHVGGAGDGCSDVATAVVLADNGDPHTFCACHTGVALRAMPRARLLVDLTLYELPAPIGAPA